MGGMSRKSFGVASMLVASGVMLVWGLVDLRTSQRLAAEGLLTRARVVGKHVERARRSIRQYVDVEYATNDGQIVRESSRISQAFYERVKAGDTVNVHYLPGDPTVHALGRTVQADYGVLLIGLLFLILGGIYHLFGT
jgi:uncharacterized protein DUF3592